MLQDSDPDVRAVAVRAANKYCFDSQQYQQDQRSLPEFTLERIFPIIFAGEVENAKDKRTAATLPTSSASSAVESLLDIALDCSGDVADVMRNIQNEFQSTSSTDLCCDDQAGDWMKIDTNNNRLVNANNARKIFEDENPNPYKEQLLLCQLAVQSLHQALATTVPSSLLKSTGSHQSRVRQIYNVSNVALEILRDELNNGGLIHDLTRCPLVFPSLHGILCATAILLRIVDPTKHQDMDDDDDDDTTTKDTVETIKKNAKIIVNDGLYLHPQIARVLNAIADDDDASDDRRIDVNNLLFLLQK
jgi:hypothetical protein